MTDTQRFEGISTQLQQIAAQAKENPDRQFTSLIHHIDVDFLRYAYHSLRKSSAAGLSGMTVRDYGKALEANLTDLHQRLKEKRYKAPFIKRVWIDKGNGQKRPIGLSEIEDKIVQKAVTMLIGAVYEQDFHPFSHGFRAGHNAHQALGEIRWQSMENNISWIIDADISGFFDNIDRSELRKMMKQRINDGGITRLIGKWLNAGVMEAGQLSYTDKGTPQGGIISPLLANLYLHHVLDEWYEKEVKPRLRGNSYLIRYADDFIIGCEREDDARKVMEVLPKRFGRYGLSIHPEKSRLLKFRKPAADKAVKRGDDTFDFLGFTHYWARSRKGYWVVKRKTARKKVRASIHALRIWCRNHRHMALDKQYKILSSKLRGHYQYFGVRCNMAAMSAVLYHAKCGWRYWLNRRSSKKALSWEKFSRLLERMPLPTPRIVHHV